MKNTTSFSGTAVAIFINGKATAWLDENITYEQLFKAAFPNIEKVMNFSAAYDYPEKSDKKGAIFHLGESVKVEYGMIFNIHNTSNA